MRSSSLRIALLLLSSSLLPFACDTDELIPEPTVARIGPEGGTLETEGVKLTVPPGALDEETELSVIEVQGFEAKGYKPASRFYRFGPSGTVFNLPVEVTLDFDQGAVGKPSVFWSQLGNESRFDDVGGLREGARITAEVSHFSIGFVGEKQEEDPGAGGAGGDGGTGGGGGSGGFDEGEGGSGGEGGEGGESEPIGTEIVAGVGSPSHFAVGSRLLFWAHIDHAGDGMAYGLASVEATGGERRVLETDNAINWIVTNNNNVYWAESTSIYRLNEGMEDPELILEYPDGINAFTLDDAGEWLYFGGQIDGGGIQKVPVAGGESPIHLGKNVNQSWSGVRGLVVLQDEVAWSEVMIPGYQKVPIDGGESTGHLSSLGNLIGGIVSDGSTIWVAGHTQGKGWVVDGDGIEVYAAESPVTSIVHAGDYIFAEVGSDIVRIRTADGEATVLSGAGKLAGADTSYLYFIADGAIRRVATDTLE